MQQVGFESRLKAAGKKDVVVVGGGPAGVIAALSARRNGADTLLIERESYLGGMMTGGGIGGIGINGYRLEPSQGRPMVVKGIAYEMFRRLQAAGGAAPGEPQERHMIDPWILIHVLDEMMEESNVQVLFNTFAFDTVVENNTVKGVAIANKSGGQVVLCDELVDASADGDMLGASGAPFVVGRPLDGRHHGGSMDLWIGGIDVDKFVDYLANQPILSEAERDELEADRSRLLGAGRPPNTVQTPDGKTVVVERPVAPQMSWDEVRRAIKEGKAPRIRIATAGGGPLPGTAAIKDGKFVPLPAGVDKEWIDYIKAGKVPVLYGAAKTVFPSPRYSGIGVFRHGEVRLGMMMSGVYECWFDQTNQEEISKAIMYMRKQNKVYLNFLRERIPGFEKAYIIMESPTVGTREARRAIGEYVLTDEDLLQGRNFEDVIAKGGPRAPDAHSVTGLWGDGVMSGPLKQAYDIPYRSLVPKEIDNLLVSGRCISTMALAAGATRDQATCMATGEAAGAAAALASSLGVAPRNLDVKLLQKALLKQGALLFSDEAKVQEILNYAAGAGV